MQGGKGIFDSFRHGIHFALLGNVLPTDNGIDSRFYCEEVFVVVLLQCICLGDGCVYFGVVSTLVLQGSNRIFDSFRHGIYLCLLCQLLSSNHRIDCSLHSGEILVVVLVQCICFGNGFIDLGIVGLLILQGSNRIFDSLCHGIDICLLCQLLSSNHRINCSLHSGEVLVVVLVQCICLGNGCVYSTVICRAILKLRIIACLRKRIAQ